MDIFEQAKQAQVNDKKSFKDNLSPVEQQLLNRKFNRLKKERDKLQASSPFSSSPLLTKTDGELYELVLAEAMSIRTNMAKDAQYKAGVDANFAALNDKLCKTRLSRQEGK